VLLGRTFVFGLHTKKPKNVKPKKPFFKNLVFSSPATTSPQPIEVMEFASHCPGSSIVSGKSVDESCVCNMYTLSLVNVINGAVTTDNGRLQGLIHAISLSRHLHTYTDYVAQLMLL